MVRIYIKIAINKSICHLDGRSCGMELGEEEQNQGRKNEKEKEKSVKT